MGSSVASPHGVPVVTAAPTLVDMGKLKSEVFPIIVLAQVAFPCCFQGMLLPNLRNSGVPGSGNAVPSLLSPWTFLHPVSLVLEMHRNTSSGIGRTQLPPCCHKKCFPEVTQAITAHSPNLSPCRRTGIPVTPSQVPQPGGTVTSAITPPQHFPAEQNWLSQGAGTFSSQAVPREPGFVTWGSLSQGCGSAAAMTPVLLVLWMFL